MSSESQNTTKNNNNNTTSSSLVTTVFDVINEVVELYLTSVIRPFLKLHETFYSSLNRVLRKILDENHVPEWFTANWITYTRTLLVIPTVLLLVWKHSLLPAMLVLLVDFGDFLDGVVARYWVEQQTKKKETPSRSASPANSDDDSFEVVTTGSPHAVLSWVRLARNRSYGGFVDAVCDKAFVIPCWISLLHLVPTTTYFKLIQYISLLCLITAETASGCIRFQAYFTSGGAPAPKVEGLDFSTSAVKADHIGKAKQTFEMVGTALFILPLTRYVGLLLLSAAVPLAYESVRRKIKKRVIYVVSDAKQLDHKKLRFWMQAKAMGSMLIVGIPGEKQTDMVLNACASSSVDQVIAEAPAKADLMFLEKHDIDYVVSAAAGQAKLFVTDEVVNANRVLALGDDGVARPVKAKSEQKTD